MSALDDIKDSAHNLAGWAICEGKTTIQAPSSISGFSLRDTPAWFVDFKSERHGPFFSKAEAEDFIFQKIA